MLWLATATNHLFLHSCCERKKEGKVFVFLFSFCNWARCKPVGGRGGHGFLCSLLLKAKAECEVDHIGLSCVVQSGLGWRFYHGDRTQLCHGSEKRQFANFVGKGTSANAWKTSHFINGAI